MIHLTTSQEQRIEAFVQSHKYESANDVIEAALTVFEDNVASAFEGSSEELEALLLEGLASGDDIAADEAFWGELRAKCERQVKMRLAQKPAQ